MFLWTGEEMTTYFNYFTLTTKVCYQTNNTASDNSSSRFEDHPGV